METISLVEYHPKYQHGIDEMMVKIQQEYAEQITSRHSTIIKDVYQLSGQKYRVALYGGIVVGTIGILLFSGDNAVVKRMMVHPEYRGKYFPTAKLLLETGFAWAKEHGAKTVWLGTMEQFIPAQKLYLKNGFAEIKEEELPGGYPPNPMDTVFYKIFFSAPR
ncbi:MAG: GNAT family N-acetyltransferase [Bacteroidota bacterium]|nr:GNAT family N-acetyltransferase [Bacteroidota bacterium]